MDVAETHDPEMTADGAVAVWGRGRPAPWLVTVDHATNRVPAEVAGGDLGLAPADMARHIAWDPGALGVARAIGRRLGGGTGAAVVGACFSRLVIDPNRGEDDPTLVMRLYDGTAVPGNRGVDGAEIERRLALYWRPYHAMVERLAEAHATAALVAVHSFTPRLRGRAPRPWHVGILSAADRRLADPLLARLRAEPGLVVGDNEPYSGALPGDSMDRHGIARGRPHVLLEIRNDLIATAEAQAAWGVRLAACLDAARADAEV